MIAFTFDLADLIMAATLASGVAATAFVHHRTAVEAAVKSKAAAAAKLAKSLRHVRMENATLSTRAATLPDLLAELAKARHTIKTQMAAGAALAERNELLEQQIQDYARAIAETFDDLEIEFDLIDRGTPASLIKSLSQQAVHRDKLERITLAHIFDCVQHGHGPLRIWAEGLGLGPYKDRLPKPVLEQASAILEADGVFEQLKEPRSILRNHLESVQAQAAEAKAGFGKRGGGQK